MPDAHGPITTRVSVAPPRSSTSTSAAHVNHDPAGHVPGGVIMDSWEGHGDIWTTPAITKMDITIANTAKAAMVPKLPATSFDRLGGPQLHQVRRTPR